MLGGRGDQLRVAAETQRRVISAAAALGYVPNHAARTLRRRSSGMINMIIPALSNPFFVEAAGAIQDAAATRGFAVSLAIARDAAEEKAAIGRVLAGSADAVVLAAHHPGNRPALGELVRRAIPCVMLQQMGPEPPVPSISIDLEAGGRLATNHLIGLGHRRIAFVTQRGARDGRYAGYRRALHEAGLPDDDRLIVETDNALAGGSAAALALLQEHDRRPTAIFTYNDQLAFGVLHGAMQAERRVPDDLAVVGFDNTAAAGFSAPELTTVSHQRNRFTIALLFALLDGEPITAMNQTVPVTLVVRQSCGAGKTRHS